jgi:hypothetical protein
MRVANPDAALLPLLLPVFVVGLGPLVFLPLVGFLGIAVIGLLIGSAAVMAQLEEQSEHARQIVAYGFPRGAEQVAYRFKLRSLMHTLTLAKIFSAALILLGVGGFLLSSSG